MKDEYQQLKNIFRQIANRVEKRADSLTEIKKLEKSKKTTRIGIEGWLKVEAAKALTVENIKHLRNKGADLVVEINGNLIEIELKAMSNFDVTDGSFKKKQADNYLYLCNADDKNKCKNLENIRNWEVVDSHTFNDGVGEWILFMMKHK